MKKFILLFLAIFYLGCTYEGEKFGDYVKDPRKFIQDPHYSSYKDQRNNLESQYLRKDITYAEYLEQMGELDDKYTTDVRDRTGRIDSTLGDSSYSVK